MSERDDLVSEHRARFAALTGDERAAAAALCDCFNAQGRVVKMEKAYSEKLEALRELGVITRVDTVDVCYSWAAQGLVEALGA